MEKLSIIRFNDDNHAERIWANGQYLGSLSNIEHVLENLLDTINNEYQNQKIFKEIDSTSIWVCDDFEDIDEDIADDIWEWFDTVGLMTKEQLELVKNKEWKKLQKII